MLGSKGRFPVPIVMVLMLGMALSSACGGSEKKEYTVPGSLCGVEVDPELLDAVLPSGDSLSEFDGIRRNSNGTTGVHGACGLDVDGQNSLLLETSASEEARTVEEFLVESHVALPVNEATRMKEGNHTVLAWPTAAVAFTSCDKSEFDYVSLSLVVDVEWTDGEEFGEELAKLADFYFAERLSEIEPQACRL